MSDVMIGVDPHKGSHTATMLDGAACELKRIRVRAGAGQVGELLAWAADAECRTWAVSRRRGWVTCWLSSSSPPASTLLTC